MHWKTGEHRWIFWFTLVGKDFTEALLYSNWTARLRQGLLSFLTLLNSDPVGQPNSENHNKVVGFSMVFSELLSWIAASLTGRKNFGFPAHGGPWPFIFHWAGGIAGGWLGGVAGWLLSWAVNASQLPEGTDADVAKPNRKSFDLMSLESLVTSLLKHPVYNYLIWSGDTDGGKFGLDRLRTYRTFKGYPPKETSPYFLPYPAGSVRQCAQGNLGPWSHNGNTNQIYAYDWDHDHWMDVLCVRAGTVMDWSDVMPDHSTFIQNEIEIKHDRTPPDPIHDRDWQEEPVETTAGYLHGAHYSIRHVFAAIGIPKENIIGTPVDQGSLVMLSGDTGMSFYNHLHMHISSPGAQTIPWVFRDEDAPDNGVLNDLTWYESSNVPALGPTDLAIARPPEQESLLHYKNAALISASGKTLEIDVYVGQSNRGIGVGSYTFDDDFFKGLVLKISKPGGGFQYQRITGSEIPSGSVQFKVENTLNPVPTRGPSTAITIECLAGKTTSNTILLDGYAREQNDTYSGRFILVWWETEDGSTAYQYKKIEDYDTGDRKVTIEGNWDRQPPEFSHYEIGGLPHADSSDFYRKFAYIPGGTSAAPARHLHNTAKSHKASVTGQPDLGGASNQLILASGTSLDPADVIGRSIAIYDINPVNSFARIIAYGFATAYVKATRTVTMANDWAVPFTSINYYEIGSPQYNNASTTQEERNEFAFICPDNDPNTYSPKDFGSPNPGKPYTSQTFKTWM
ncbi:MAG TPA: hypothetical protein ENJ82_13000 [Bacteroidetes bacterium]|nr:hypothetical protein [Bacteroidota bacterium]